MPTDHNAILTARAREVPRPVGFTQRGRPRTWQEDHGAWILFVDLQASGFLKATYLNVLIHWLWRLGDDPLTGGSMDYGNRVAGAGASVEHYFGRLTQLPDDRDYFAPYRDLSRRWLRLVRADHGLFVDEVVETVNHQRSRLKLEPVGASELLRVTRRGS